MGKSEDKCAPPVWQRLGVEGVGTYVVILVHALAAGYFGSTGSNPVLSAVAVGLIQGISVYHAVAYYYKSGPHLNFVITLLAAWFKTSPRVKGVAILGYILVQLGFGVLAGLTAQFILGLLGISLVSAVPFVNTADGVTLGGGFLIELLLSFVSLLTFLIASREFGAKESQNNPALAAGLTHAILVALGFVYTGGSINPVRHFSVAILDPANHFDENSWIYYVAPVVAGLTAVVVYALFFKNLKSK